jgi:alkanesulfonate monooxygenase SsuD/methylene tetrahydromethanopterin reductase-like flavin-dependent oxidoreductase (luciferase family)
MAKQVSSLAVLSDDRLTLGVGLSPWPDDYQVVDIPWERRGKRLDEMIEIIRGLCAGDYFEYDGEIIQIPSIKICPVSKQPIPIIIGGHSEPALRRAARIGDGWIHAGGDGDELQILLRRLEELRREYGRENDPFELHVISLDAYVPDGVRRLEDMGVTDLLVGFRNAYTKEQDGQSLEEKLTALRQYSDTVISKCR